MAKSKCVAVKCEVKDVFDKKLKPAVLEQIKETVKKLVDKNKSKGLTFDANCKDGWLLTATVLALNVDDVNKPTSMEAKVSVDGVLMGGTAKGFKAAGNGKATGINAKKLPDEAKGIVNDVLEDLLTKKVIPQMLKP